MTKKLNKIIGNFLIIILIFLMIPVSALAENKSPFILCRDFRPDFKKLGTDLKLPNDPVFTESEFETAFLDAQEEYHVYVQCVFDISQKYILDAPDESYLQTGMLANNPNALDWMKPDIACIDQKQIVSILEAVSFDVLLIPLLDIYNKYGDYLDSILVPYAKQNKSNDDSEKDLYDLISQTIARSEKAERLIENEKESALVAMDTSFYSLKELKTAFIMHVNFQCMMQSLGKYRNILEDIRNIVDDLLTRLPDAAKSK